MFRKKKKNYHDEFIDAFTRLSVHEKNHVIELAKQISALAEKHSNLDPNKWGNMEDTIYAIELNNQIKSIVFRDKGGAVPNADGTARGRNRPPRS